MTLQAESQQALDIVERLQLKLHSVEGTTHQDDLSNLIYLLDSPLFNRIASIQDSMSQLKQIQQTRSLAVEDFDVDVVTGDLVLSPGTEDWDSAVPHDSHGDSHATSPNLGSSVEDVPQLAMHYDNRPTSPTHRSESFQQTIERIAEGRQLEVLHLYKHEGMSLGFSVAGLRSDVKGELGIFVQAIQKGGIAHQDGRLREGDQIVALDEEIIHAGITHQQAIRFLQQAVGEVKIIVARSATPTANSPGSAPSTDLPPDQPISNSQYPPLEEQHHHHHVPSTCPAPPASPQAVPNNPEVVSDMVLSAEWTQVEVIDLINDGTGLGFGIIGGKSTGVVIKTILPGGIADRDDRLRSGDHMFQIGDINVRGMSSEMVATVLRQCGTQVRLIVARGISEPTPEMQAQAPIIPTTALEEHLQQLYEYLLSDSREELEFNPQQFNPADVKLSNSDIQIHQPPHDISTETEHFEVELSKGSHGLGITIAGYVGEKDSEELSGIFVQSISPNSAAELDGRIKVNDQITEVDSTSLEGFTNIEAVQLLRNTSQVVRLKLVRYKHGLKYEQLSSLSTRVSEGDNSIDQMSLSMDKQPFHDISTRDNENLNLEEITLLTNDNYNGPLDAHVESAIKSQWLAIIGDPYEIVVAQLSKFNAHGGLGISLEGTVDVENDVEVRPHHYIGSVLSEGPIGRNGRLKSGDELLEVNGVNLMGMDHVKLVETLKELPQHVRIVCARKRHNQPPYTQEGVAQYSPPMPGSITPSAYMIDQSRGMNTAFVSPSMGSPRDYNESAEQTEPLLQDRLVKAKSEQMLPIGATSPNDEPVNKNRSRSLEPLTKLAMWSNEPVVIELVKGDHGLGFSILDYQDPINPDEMVIVILSLVPGGVAHVDGRLVPGDRLLFVNDHNLEQSTLEEAVGALKGAPSGVVCIGVAKPLPIPDFGESSTDEIVTPERASFEHASLKIAHANQTNPLLSGTETSPQDAATPARDISPPHTPPPPPPNVSFTPGVEVEFGYATLQQLENKELDVEENEESKLEAIKITTESTSPPSDNKSEPARKPPVLNTSIQFSPVGHSRTESDSSFSSVSSNEETKTTSDLNVKPEKITLSTSPTLSNNTVPSPPVTRPYKSPFLLSCPRPYSVSNTSTSSSVVSSVNYSPKGSPEQHSQGSPEQHSSPSSPEQLNLSTNTKSPSTSPVTPTSPDKPQLPPKPTQLPPKPALSPEQQQRIVFQNKARQELYQSATPPVVPHGLTSPTRVTQTKEKQSYQQSTQASKVLSAVDLDELPPYLPPPTPLGSHHNPASITHSPASATHNPASSAHSTASSFHANQSHSENTTDTSGLTTSAPIVTSSLSQFTHSPPVNVPSTSIEPVFTNNVTAAITNSSYAPLSACKNDLLLPSALERTIKVVKGMDTLGLTVDAQDKAINGCVAKTIQSGSAIAKDGRLSVGDYIISINNESMKRITNSQARAILRRSSLLSTDISICYIPAQDATVHQQTALITLREQGPSSYTPPSQLSPKSKLSSTASQSDSVSSPGHGSDGGRSSLTSLPTTPTDPVTQFEPDPFVHSEDPVNPADRDESGLTCQTWAEPRYVDIHRKPGESLGISIVGGKVDVQSAVGITQPISGIFIKHVLDTSPAGRKGTLKTGDRILGVDGVDLRNASHDRAVEVIKNSSSPVQFCVQSLMDPLWLANGASNSSPVPESSPGGTTADANGDAEESSDEESKQQDWDKIVRTYSDLIGQLHLIEFTRSGSNGLGISLAGNRDLGVMSVFVVGIQPDSPTAKDGRIKVGDELLEVNGQVLYGRSHLNASAMIKSISSSKVRVVLRRREDYMQHMAVRPLKLPHVETRDDPTTLIAKRIKLQHDDSEDSSIASQDSIRLRNGDLAMNRNAKASPLTNDHSNTFSEANKKATFSLRKANAGLGFAIREGSMDDTRAGIFCKSITPGGLADKEGTLSVGDQMLSVNGNSLVGVSYEKAIDMLRKTTGTVTLSIEKNASTTTAATQQNGVLTPTSPPKPIPVTNDKSPSTPSGKTTPSTTPNDTPSNTMQHSPVPNNQSSSVIDKSPAKTAEPTPSPTQSPAPQEDRPPTPPAPLVEDKPLSVQKPQDTPITNGTPSSPPPALLVTEPPSKPAPPQDTNPATCPILANQETAIEIQKGRSGLGLSIVGGADTLLGAIIIHEVYEDGAAAKDGRIWAGDQVLEVNQENLRAATHEKAIQVLRQTSAVVKMLVYRDDTQQTDQDMYDIFKVELVKKPGKGLGLSIVGKRNDVGAYVSDVVKGGAADIDGRIMHGDQILSVNNDDLRSATQEEAATVLKTVIGKVTITVRRLKGSRRGSTISDRGVKKSDSNLSSKGKTKNKRSSVESTIIRTVSLERNIDGSLGLSIAGGVDGPLGDTPIIVAHLTHNGPAARSGLLKTGDQILSINDIPIEGCTHTETVEMLKTSEAPIILEVVQGEALMFSQQAELYCGSESDNENYDSENHDSENYDVEPRSPDIERICLERGDEGLGFTIVGGFGSPPGDLPIYVKTVYDRGAASVDGRLKPGDQLIAVNGQSLQGVTHEEAVTILKNAVGVIELAIIP